MSVTVFVASEDIKDVFWMSNGLEAGPSVMVSFMQPGSSLHVSVAALERILELGKADQARQDAAVQS